MLNKSAKSFIISNTKASVVELLQMYSEATASKSECEKRYLQLLQESATQNLTAANNQSNQLINELKRQLEQAEKQLKEQGEAFKRQQDLAVNGLKSELDKLRGEIDDKNISISKMRDAAKELQEQKNQQIEDLKADYELQLSTLQQELTERQEILEQLRQSLASLNENLTEQKAKESAYLKEQEQMRTQLSQKDILIQNLSQDIQKQKEVLELNHQKIEELQIEASKRETLDQWLQMFQKSLQVKNNLIQEQTQKLEELSKSVPAEYQDLHQTILDQQQEFAQQKKQLEDTINSNKTLIEEHLHNIGAQQQKIQDQEIQIQELQSGLNSLQTLVAEFASRESLNAQKNEQMMQLREEHEQEIDKLEQLLEECQLSLNKAEKEKNDLHGKYEDMQMMKDQEIQNLKEKISLQEHTYNHLLSQYQVYLKRTTISLESFDKDTINEGTLIKDYDKQTQDLYKEMDFMIESITQMNEQLKESQDRNGELNSQLHNQNEEIERLCSLVGEGDNPMESGLVYLSSKVQQLLNELSSQKGKSNSLQKEIDFLRLKTTSQENKMRNLEEGAQLKQRQSIQLDAQVSELQKIIQQFQNDINILLHVQIGNGFKVKEFPDQVDSQQILTGVKQLLEQYIIAVKSEMNNILQKVADIHYHGDDKESSPNRIREDFFTYSQRTSDLLDSIKSKMIDSNQGSRVSVTYSEQSEKKEKKVRNMKGSTLFLMKKNLRTSRNQPFLTTYLTETEAADLRKRADMEALSNMLDQDSDEEQ